MTTNCCDFQCPSDMDKGFKKPTTLDVRGNLNLATINFPKFPKNVTVSEELNDYLRDQLEQMKREHEALQDAISKKDSQNEASQLKIKELTEKITDYESCSEFTSTPQLTNSKIIELSKKLREKNSEVEVYKSKCAKIEKKLSELTMKENTNQDTEKQDTPINEPDEIKKLQDKVAYAKNKWLEEKNVNSQLKNDLKRANKWLLQEVGDKFETLLTLNNANSSWRGRAQIICDLQQKNQELREKLKVYQENNKDKCLSPEPNPTKCDKKVEALSKENLELKNNYSEVKRKFDAVKARCRVLENEYGVLKAKISTLTEVHEADQQIVAKLTSQMSYYNEQKTEDLKQKDQIIKNLQQENEALKVELFKEKCLSENKSKELVEKNDDIQLLNKRIRSSRPPSAYVRRPENPDTKTINKLEVERLRLLELTSVHNTRLEEERNTHFKTQHLLRVEKQKCAKLEANLARLQLEQNSARSGYSSKLNTPKLMESDIRDKLEIAEENVKALTTRLEIETMERKRDLQEFSKILKNCKCD